MPGAKSLARTKQQVPVRKGKIRPRPIILSFLLLFATVMCGLTIRFAPLGLPSIVVKYGGSFLWALMIYWIVSALLPSTPLRTVALLSCGITTAVECFKLYHSRVLDAFRLTLSGALLFGRIFSVWDVVAYCVAIFAGVLIDARIRSAF